MFISSDVTGGSIIIYLVLLLFCISSSAYSSGNYGIDIGWDPGLENGIPEKSITANVQDYGAVGDGITDDYPAFIEAINSVTDSGVIIIPEGDYLLKNMIEIEKPVILRGEGTGKTRLLIEHYTHAFEIITYQRGEWTNIDSGYEKGSNELIVEDPSEFKKNAYVEIQQENDPELMYTLDSWNAGWAAGARGQIAQVVEVDGNKIIIDKPLRLDYYAEFNPQIRTQGFVENVGFEDFSIKRLDTSDAHMFYYKNAAKCWIKNIHSMLASKSHVSVNTGYRLEIRDSFFDDATNWGGGGHGYGVELGYHTTDTLVENNVFKHLRHSMMVHVGANGNVFGYNYSIEPESEGSWTPCDISLHGHYPNNNLFEGNIIQELDISDYWGPSGPNNTVFRNRIESEGINIEDSSNYQNIIGNEIVKGNIEWDTDDRYPHLIDPETLLIHGNYVEDSLQWDESISSRVFPCSYYLTDKPDFYGNMEWPSTGADKLMGSNPARERYLGNDIPDAGNKTGDLNNDKLVDSIDLTIFRRYILGIKSLSSEIKQIADFNNDTFVDSIDFSLLRRYLIGVIDKL